MASSQFYPNRAAIIRIVGNRTDAAAKRGAEAGANYARRNIVSDGLIDTGEMLAGVVVRESPFSTPLRKRYEIVSKAKHTHFQEEGTKGAVAAPGKFLVFKPKGSATFVFAKKVRGVPAHHFMRRAKLQIRRSDFLP